MKLSGATLDVLKNFSDISDSIIIKPGNVLSTISESRFIVARAEVAESFPAEAPFFNNLGKLIKLIKLLDDPEVDFQDTKVVITSGRFRQVIRYSDLSVTKILAPKADPKTKHFDWNTSFDIAAKDFAVIDKAATISNSPNIVFESDGAGPIKVVARDESDSSSNEHVLELDVSSPDKFRIVFLRENFKMIPGDYRVSVHVGDHKITHWARQGEGPAVEYWLAVELGSTYGA